MCLQIVLLLNILYLKQMSFSFCSSFQLLLRTSTMKSQCICIEKVQTLSYYTENLLYRNIFWPIKRCVGLTKKPNITKMCFSFKLVKMLSFAHFQSIYWNLRKYCTLHFANMFSPINLIGCHSALALSTHRRKKNQFIWFLLTTAVRLSQPSIFLVLHASCLIYLLTKTFFFSDLLVNHTVWDTKLRMPMLRYTDLVSAVCTTLFTALKRKRRLLCHFPGQQSETWRLSFQLA